MVAGYGRTVLIQGKAVAGGNGIGGLVVLRPIGVRAEGDVIVERNADVLNADWAQYDRAADTIFADLDILATGRVVTEVFHAGTATNEKTALGSILFCNEYLIEHFQDFDNCPPPEDLGRLLEDAGFDATEIGRIRAGNRC